MGKRAPRLRVVSWNVNGLRACAGKGFLEWLRGAGAHVVGLQEVRAEASQLPRELREPARWHTHFVAAERRGYSGVGLYSRFAPDGVESCVEAPDFDREGRVQIAHFGRLSVANIYFPKGSGRERDNSRVPYKLAFYEHVLARLSALRARGQRVLVMGDFNTAHREIDLARPRANRKNSGFLPEECAALDAWVQAGFVDTFRHFECTGGHYTWWRQWGPSRENNVGWRIDYVFACPEAMPYVQRAFIWPDVRMSDHCPVGVELRADIMADG
ncbi:MAG: exodeoxyribonuclease III [Myxococcales bacterium]